MDSECNPVSQKRRVGVDEDLYDFTEEELNFIRRSRQEAENDGPDVAIRIRNVKVKYKSELMRGDTDGQEKYFSTLALDNLSCSSKSSEDSFQTADGYPEIEGSRWADSDSGGGGGVSRPSSPIMKRSRSIVSDNDGTFECQPGLDNFSFCRKKMIVPEPELSDPNFPGYEDSTEESSPVQPLHNPRYSLRQKLSTFGRLLISSTNSP